MKSAGKVHFLLHIRQFKVIYILQYVSIKELYTFKHNIHCLYDCKSIFTSRQSYQSLFFEQSLFLVIKIHALDQTSNTHELKQKFSYPNPEFLFPCSNFLCISKHIHAYSF